MTLKEKCLNTLDPNGSNTWQRIEWLAGNALRNRQHAVDALGDLCEAVKLVAVIVAEEAGGRAYEAQRENPCGRPPL